MKDPDDRRQAMDGYQRGDIVWLNSTIYSYAYAEDPMTVLLTHTPTSRLAQPHSWAREASNFCVPGIFAQGIIGNMLSACSQIYIPIIQGVECS